MDFRVVKIGNAKSVTQLLGSENWGSCCPTSHSTLINSSWAQRRNGPTIVLSGHGHLLLDHQPDREVEDQGCGDALICENIKLLPSFVAICKPSEEMSNNVKKQTHNTEHTIVL
jgi:hypothetical protein